MTIERDISLTCDKFAGRVRALCEHLTLAYQAGLTETHFKVFETYRSPSRQLDMIARKVSKAGPWQSAHQFGLAVDIVPFLSPLDAFEFGRKHVPGGKILPGWNWDPAHDYSFLATSAKKFDLATPISWDPCHVEHPLFPEFRSFWRRYFE